MKQRICSKCGRIEMDGGSSGKKYVCAMCSGLLLKPTDLREQERKRELYLTAERRKSLSA